MQETVSGSCHQNNTAFLLGAGRSGTTLLYKLLCLHDSVSYISNAEKYLGFLPCRLTGKIRFGDSQQKRDSWFNSSGNAYKPARTIAQRLQPMPIEGEFLYKQCGVNAENWKTSNSQHLRRLHACFNELSLARKQHKVFLSKRTANNRRVAALLDVFPEARYIHLVRDGREVARSLTKVDWWSDHTLWWDNKTPAQARAAGADDLDLAATNWAKEIEALSQDLDKIPPEQLLTVRYEQLLAAPIETLHCILGFLNIKPEATFNSAVKSLNLAYKLGDFSTDWTDQQLASVTAIQSSFLRKLGYTQ